MKIPQRTPEVLLVVNYYVINVHDSLLYFTNIVISLTKRLQNIK